MQERPFIAVMIIPTGIGANIGGHAGDATPAARLLAGACDTLIVHPNVVNAADLNEMPANALYVEGSMLDRFLSGERSLRTVHSNHILVVCNELTPETVNCVKAARSLLGAKVELDRLNEPLVMRSWVSDHINGIATGEIEGIKSLCEQFGGRDFDVLAIHTPIETEQEGALEYLRHGGVNPWGGVEAILSRRVSELLNKPVAHAPVEMNPAFNEIVPQAIAPELISGSNLFSVLKGLHKAPRYETPRLPADLVFTDVDVLISPPCWGRPHKSCVWAGIPMIFVYGNTTNAPEPRKEGEQIRVQTYLEAAGAMIALRQGLCTQWIEAGGVPARNGTQVA